MVLRRFLATLAVGLIIELSLFVLHASGRLGQIEDIGAGWSMRLFRNVALEHERALPFLFVDIDEETYRDWGEQLVVPRAQLGALIERTLEGLPKLLIIDVDLAYRDGVGDEVLAETLARHGRDGAPVPIVLARSLRSSRAEPGSVQPRPRPSFLDAVVDRAPNLHWAGVWLKTAPDLIVRRWPLWQLACTDGRPMILPSVPLVTLALVEAPKDGLDNFQRELAPLASGNCTQPPKQPKQAELLIGDRPVPLDEEGWILFTIPWHLPEGESRPLVGVSEVHRTPLLATVSAGALLAAAEGPEPGALDGAIAVIGGSYAEGRDLHMTPLGLMPGALIAINAAHTALQHGALRPPTPAQKLLFAGSLIVVVALFFARFSIATATFLSLFLAIAATAVVSIRWLNSGIWLDATIPILGILLHRWAAALEHGWKGHQSALARLRLWRRRNEAGASSLPPTVGG